MESYGLRKELCPSFEMQNAPGDVSTISIGLHRRRGSRYTNWGEVLPLS
jgi:hypothetical protein